MESNHKVLLWLTKINYYVIPMIVKMNISNIVIFVIQPLRTCYDMCITGNNFKVVLYC